MKKIVIFSLAVLAFTLLSGCSKEEASKKPGEFIPQDDTSLTYKYMHPDEPYRDFYTEKYFRVINDHYANVIVKQRNSIEKEGMYLSQRVFAYKETDDSLTEYYIGGTRSKEQADEIYNKTVGEELAKKTDDAEIILRFPLKEGKRWGEYKIIDMDATVNTPAGSYQDVIVVERTYKRTSDYQATLKIYLVKGIGIVKSEGFRDGKLDYAIELQQIEKTQD